MEKLRKINQTLEQFYKEKSSISDHLVQAILYSIQAGGKRLRPLLLLEMIEAFGLDLEKSHYQLAAAVEMIHTGSLVHDDLPAMDNDDYRRGQLTNHKKFDEATAILAGDSLFLDPFGLVASSQLEAEIKVKIIQALSESAGTYGMVAGQMLDMDAEGRTVDLPDLQAIHSHKTGKLLAFPFIAAGLVAGVSEAILKKLEEAGNRIGHAFQVRDDILDLIANFEEIGKTPNKDLDSQKGTYPSLLGLEKSHDILQEDLDQSIAILLEIKEMTDFNPVNIIAIIERLGLNG
ncbi:polyprenyl synthetase family protein [Streptococcus catagoni]|uniref:polyprenyl synthetase family protein n=1 Tax=Streptococcus catagoni TaxID=2654874 RepID=UPI001409CAA2|nr:farnesyl diphosphate synthase [Streptococcus catagoni]